MQQASGASGASHPVPPATPAAPGPGLRPPSARKGPILVTGSHRSGSTWVGNQLALAANCGYVHEPFNTRTRAGLSNAPFPTDFTYVTAGNEALYLPGLRDTLNWRYALGPEIRSLRTPRDAGRMIRDYGYFETMRLRGARMIVKDPIAIFSANWLVETFDMPAVIIIRHPAAFVASLIAAGWVKFPFRILAAQTELMRDRLAPFEGEIAAAAADLPEPLEVGILLWRLIHHHIRLLRAEHPDWIFVRHEDLSRDPVGAFRDLYGRIGLDFTDRIEARIRAMSGQDGGVAALSIFGTTRRVVRNSQDTISYFRKRLTPEQIAAIRRGAEDVWPDFYAASEW